MKIRVTIKDPDGVTEAIREFVEQEKEKIKHPLLDDNPDELDEQLTNAVNKKMRVFFEYLEYLTVEVDLDNNTIQVIKPD